jgi:creatinine amidohydrolase/Fe(II)-dependent formamide hydrolase-like protein
MEQTNEPASLQTLAAAAAMPLECAAAIAEHAAKGFIAWVTFEVPDCSIYPIAFAGRAFTTLEKAQNAIFRNDNGYSVTYAHIPYRMHGCGAKDVVYVYCHGGSYATVTNVADDLENQAREMPWLFSDYVSNGLWAGSFAYKLDAGEYL